MSREAAEKRSWQQVMLCWLAPQSVAMLFLGFSAGLPLWLIFSTLSVWLTEAGVVRSTVTFFSWAALGYSFKFLWAPIVDMLPLPWLTARLGRRRGWLLLSQLMVIASIAAMGSVDPAKSENSLLVMALGAVLLGFSSATQDIVIDAYRIESAESDLQALLSSMYIAGYRIGMLAAGAGGLILAEFFGTSKEHYIYHSWQVTYYILSGLMLVGVATTLFIREPIRELHGTKKKLYSYKPLEYGRFLIVFACAVMAFCLVFFFSRPAIVTFGELVGVVADKGALSAFIVEGARFCLAIFTAFCFARLAVTTGIIPKDMLQASYIAPVRDFFLRYPLKTAITLLLLIGFYRVSDIVLGVIANVFYTDIGFSKAIIATITKTFGLGMTLVGGFFGGFLTVRYGVLRVLFLGALLSAATNLLFVLLARTGSDVGLLTVVIAADNLSAGIATTAFVAFLSSLTNISFTAMQYALFSSMMTLFPKLIGGYSGTVITQVGYETFFWFTALAGIPVLFLIAMVRKGFIDQNHQENG